MVLIKAGDGDGGGDGQLRGPKAIQSGSSNLKLPRNSPYHLNAPQVEGKYNISHAYVLIPV
jgi:hypothetical protein